MRPGYPAFTIQSNGWIGIRQIVQEVFRPLLRCSLGDLRESSGRAETHEPDGLSEVFHSPHLRHSGGGNPFARREESLRGAKGDNGAGVFRLKPDRLVRLSVGVWLSKAGRIPSRSEGRQWGWGLQAEA